MTQVSHLLCKDRESDFVSSEYCSYSNSIHLDCFIICMGIQMASFTAATLAGPLWGEIQKQLLSDSSFSTDPLCHVTTQGLSLPAKAEIALNSSLRPWQWQGQMLATKRMFVRAQLDVLYLCTQHTVASGASFPQLFRRC